MNFENLSKEQKQYIVLGVLTVAILVVLGGMGLKNSLSAGGSSEEELEILTRNIQQANERLGQKNTVDLNFATTRQQVQRYLQYDLPARKRNRLVYPPAERAGLKIVSTEEVSEMGRRSGRGETTLESYALNVSATGSYASVIDFIQIVTEEFPLARVLSVDIKPGRGSVTQHDVHITIQWLCNFDSIIEDLGLEELLFPEMLTGEVSATNQNVQTVPLPVTEIEQNVSEEETNNE